MTRSLTSAVSKWMTAIKKIYRQDRLKATVPRAPVYHKSLNKSALYTPFSNIFLEAVTAATSSWQLMPYQTSESFHLFLSNHPRSNFYYGLISHTANRHCNCYHLSFLPKKKSTTVTQTKVLYNGYAINSYSILASFEPYPALFNSPKSVMLEKSNPK